MKVVSSIMKKSNKMVRTTKTQKLASTKIYDLLIGLGANKKRAELAIEEFVEDIPKFLATNAAKTSLDPAAPVSKGDIWRLEAIITENKNDTDFKIAKNKNDLEKTIAELKSDLEKTILKWMQKLEKEESFSSSKKPFEDQFYDNSESPEVEMEMESIKNIDKENLFIKTKEEQ